MYCAFDIETTGLFEEGKPAPDVTCAATRLVRDGVETVKSWHSDYADTMTVETMKELLEYLWEQHLCGVTVTSFNGAGFDFRVLFEHTRSERARRLAAVHCDVMYQFAVEHGYYASLQSFCEGEGIKGKTGSGVDAIDMWAHGDKDEVLRYCENDVRALGDVYAHTAARGGCKRKTKRGNTTFAAFALVEGALMNVGAAAAKVVKDEVPDTSWMKDPPDLLASVAWIWPAG